MARNVRAVIYLVFNYLNLYTVYGLTYNEIGSVKFVNLLWRHGARTPANFYVNDPYKDESYWPDGIGQLTNTGKRQQYELGQWLRNRYDSLLKDGYSPDLVYAQSTDVDRTLMSAQCNLAGMFPPKEGQVWNTRLAWQPIPVHTTPEEQDKVLAAKAPCPAYDKEYDAVLRSEEILELYERYKDVVEIVRDNAGGDNIDLKYIHDTYDTLNIENLSGYTIPKWARDILPQMQEVSRYRFLIETWTKKLGRLKSGLLIQDMIENMKNKTEKHISRNVNIYSAHDTTIANFLNTLGVYDMKTPPYASCVMLELRVDSANNAYVTLFYRNSTAEEPHLLTVPGCAPVCALDQFISVTTSLIPNDWDKECQSA